MSVLDLLYKPIRYCETCHIKIDTHRCSAGEDHDVAEYGKLYSEIIRVGTWRKAGSARRFEHERLR
jgi:hypothetical protein